MRTLLYIVILGVLIAVPAERSDVGNLLPVEVILIDKDDQGIKIQTDTGNAGAGDDLEAAYQNLRERAPADIYLDTANYLILSGEAQELAPQLSAYLKAHVKVCIGEGELDVTEVAAYLATHTPDTHLCELNKEAEIQVLTQAENGFSLE